MYFSFFLTSVYIEQIKLTHKYMQSYYCIKNGFKFIWTWGGKQEVYTYHWGYKRILKFKSKSLPDKSDKS